MPKTRNQSAMEAAKIATAALNALDAKDKATKLRENWSAKKEQYNAQRRAAYAAKATATVPQPRGRPPKPPRECVACTDAPAPAPAPDAPSPATAAHAMSKAASTVRNPSSDSAHISIPKSVQMLWGVSSPKIPIRLDLTTWSCWCAARWYGDGTGVGSLSEKTKAAYVAQFKRACKITGTTPPNSADARVLGRWFVGFGVKNPPADIWTVVETISTGRTLTQQTEFSKALLAILNATILDIVLKDEVKTEGFARAWRYPLIVQYWNKLGKADTDKTREVAAHVSEKTRANVVDWEQWKTRSAEYITEVLGKGDKATLQELQQAAIIALYSQIPPIRWDWRRVKLGTTVPTPDDFGDFPTENVAVVSKDGVLEASYFKDFKNAKSFATPVEIKLTQPPLLNRIMQAYFRALPKGAVFLFPKDLTTKAGLRHEMTQSAIADIVASKSQEWFNKRFTNVPMRKSYVSYWHSKNPEITAKKLKDDMRQMHQDTAGTRLTYILENNRVNVDNLLKEIN